MRRAPIVPLPQDLGRLVGVLERSLGFVVPLLELPLVRVEAGLAASGTLLSTIHTVDWNDTGADEWRLTGYGDDAASSGSSLEYRVNGVILASVAMPQGGADDFAGSWMRLTVAQRATIANDRVGQLQVIGGGTLTLHSVTLQARTVSRVV